MNIIRAIGLKSVTPATNIDRKHGEEVLLPKSPKNEVSAFKNSDKNSISPELLKDSSSKEKINTSETQKNKIENPNELTDEEKKIVEELKKVDKKVRTHEQAHVSAGGGLIKGGITYTLRKGPDNKQYAIGGSVNIDLSPEKGDSEATIRKMQKVKRAALAPVDPSPQDRNIASTATRIETKARTQLRREKTLDYEDANKNIAKASKNDLINKYKTQDEAFDFSSMTVARLYDKTS